MRRALLVGALTLALVPAQTEGQEEPSCSVGRVPVTGRVLDLLTLRPVPGATVSAFTTEGQLAGSVATGDDGAYLLCAVSGVRRLRLRAFADDVTATEADVSPGSAGDQRDLYIRLTRPATLRGTVVDRPTSQPVEGLVIEMEGTRRTAVTGADGRFEIPNVPAGVRAVLLRHLTYGVRRDSVSLASGEVVDVRVEVAPRAIELDPLLVVARRLPSGAEQVGIRFDGLGREEIDRLLASTRSFPALLQNARVPGLTVRETTIDGRHAVPALCIESGRRRSRRAGPDPRQRRSSARGSVKVRAVARPPLRVATLVAAR
ncbi:MAG: carboxypeptidase regulatory-like domain-containing protein [Gemmatimonadetes bacterium]|nr:carboxypeptidase regulatory-like domain-containing protein [Gemmatimonadota bacterium]